MKILVTNDDGVYSRGIFALAEALAEVGEVSVVAPVTEQSAVGHAITIADTLRVFEAYRKEKFFGYGIKGTPADCVKLAVDSLLPEKPDLVVSGINHGANVATNVIYSGTVSAATEGAMLGIPSIAVSLATKKHADFTVAARFAAFFAQQMQEMNCAPNTIFNINVPALPAEEIKGWKYAVQGMTRFLDTFERRVDPQGRTYYWLTGEMPHESYLEDGDDSYLKQGYITVTPLQFDMTDHSLYRELKGKENTPWKR